MVVKSSSEGREPLKSSDTNRPREGPCKSFKPKNGKAIAPKIRGTTNYILVSPSKKLLPSASMTSIKSSPSKHQDQENITPRTPEKSELLHKTPQKLSTAFIKLSPSSLGSSPSQRIGNPCFSSVFSTPSSSSASPSSSCISGSPNSPVVRVEEDLQQPDSPIINALNQTHSPDSLLGTDSRSIVGGGLNLSGSCIKRVATRHGPLGGQPGPPVSRRNARERNRVKQVSMGFAMLRQHVPHSNRKKKLSKVETLRCAVEYIKNLQSLLQENPHPLHPTTSSTSSLQQKIPVAANFQTQSATPSSESFLHLQVSSHFDLQQRESDRGPFSLQKMSHLSSSFQQGGQANAFYEDRLSLQPMPNGSSCLEPQLLKVPKMEEHFQTPVYSSSIFTIPSVSFVKTPTMAFSSSLVGSLDGGPCPGESKDIHPSMVSDAAADYTHGFPQQKDVGEVDLMEALAWWQHNS